MDVRECAFSPACLLTGVQTTISLCLKDPSTTFGTLVRAIPCTVQCFGAERIEAEPLESELAVQVEYDMDEQGARH
jgi:hypothetical protein